MLMHRRANQQSVGSVAHSLQIHVAMHVLCYPCYAGGPADIVVKSLDDIKRRSFGVNVYMHIRSEDR